MKPRPYVQIQAFAAAAATLVLLAVLGEGAALPVAVFLSAGLCIWLFFAGRYYVLLRAAEASPSAERSGKDRVMLACLLGGLVLPCVLAWAEFGVNLDPFGDPPLQGSDATLVTLSVLAIPLGIFVSSSVDWYLIRPFREGVYNEPVCRPEVHEQARAMDYARYWIMHRMVSEFFVYAGTIVLVALALAIAGEATDSERGKSALSFVGGLGIAVWSLSELSGLRAALRFVRYPHCELGSWIAGRTAYCDDAAGFVLDVSVSPGVQLIDKPRGYPAPDIADADRSIPLRQAHNIKPIEPPFRVCSEKCEFWVPDCEIGLRELERSRASTDRDVRWQEQAP